MSRLSMTFSLRCSLLLLAMAGTGTLAAQSLSDKLAAYTACSFADGLRIVQVDPLASGVTSREVETDSGTRQIEMEAGLRIMFAYPDSDFYANVKAESLPAANYLKQKQYLLDNLRFLASGNILNKRLKSPKNSFDVYGLDREKLEGGVLGVYLLFDNASHVVTTIYFLNQEAKDRKFQTIEEYRSLRDRFLESYSACVHINSQVKK